MLLGRKPVSFTLVSLNSLAQVSGSKAGGRYALPRQLAEHQRRLITTSSLPAAGAGATASLPQCYISHSNDPWTNLAFEEWLLRDVPEPTEKLFLYRNRSSIVLGRNQNPWIECDVPALDTLNVPLIRRQSGGGTVYHDMGNTNYSVMTSRDTFDRRTAAQIVSNALNDHLDIPTKVNERNDVTLYGDKVSGSAYKVIGKAAYHHGTMLINADLTPLRILLKGKRENIISKGVTSVPSTVANLQEASFTVDHSSFCDAVARAYLYHYAKRPEDRPLLEEDLIVLTDEMAHGSSHIQKYRKTLKSWEWTWGQTPEFTEIIPVSLTEGILSLHLRVKHGVIQEARPSLSESQEAIQISKALVGKRYGTKDVQDALMGVAPSKITTHLASHLAHGAHVFPDDPLSPHLEQ